MTEQAPLLEWVSNVVYKDWIINAAGRCVSVEGRRWAGYVGLCFLSAAAAIVTKESLARQELEPLARVTSAVRETVVPQVEPASALASVRDPLVEQAGSSDVATESAQSLAAAIPVAKVEAPVLTPVVAPVLDPRLMSDTSIRFFNGRPIKPVRTMTMVVTAYSPDERSCGPRACGMTSSVHNVYTNGMNLVAADTRVLPLGSIISVPGYDGGKPVPVLDRGGAIKGHRLDVLYPTDHVARQWGVQKLEVTVWAYADGLPADDYRKVRDSRE